MEFVKLGVAYGILFATVLIGCRYGLHRLDEADRIAEERQKGVL